MAGSRGQGTEGGVGEEGLGLLTSFSFSSRKVKGCPGDVKHWPWCRDAFFPLGRYRHAISDDRRVLWEAPCFVYMLMCTSLEPGYRVRQHRAVKSRAEPSVRRDHREAQLEPGPSVLVQTYSQSAHSTGMQQAYTTEKVPTSSPPGPSRHIVPEAMLCRSSSDACASQVRFINFQSGPPASPLLSLGARGPRPEMIASRRRFHTHIGQPTRKTSSHVTASAVCTLRSHEQKQSRRCRSLAGNRDVSISPQTSIWPSVLVANKVFELVY